MNSRIEAYLAKLPVWLEGGGGGSGGSGAGVGGGHAGAGRTPSVSGGYGARRGSSTSSSGTETIPEERMESRYGEVVNPHHRLSMGSQPTPAMAATGHVGGAGRNQPVEKVKGGLLGRSWSKSKRFSRGLFK